MSYPSSSQYIPSTYPGAPSMQSSSPYPPSPYSYSSGYESPSPMPPHSTNRGEASSFYGSSPPAVKSHYNQQQYQQYQQYPEQQVQYDSQGNPIPMDGERGLGTMAAGGMVGWGANKLSGNKVGGGKSFFGGAVLAQVGKKVYEKMDEKKNGKHGKHGKH